MMFLLTLFVKAAVLLSLGLGLCYVLRRRSASLRRDVMVITLAGTLVLPLLSLALPSVDPFGIFTTDNASVERPLTPGPWRWSQGHLQGRDPDAARLGLSHPRSQSQTGRDAIAFTLLAIWLVGSLLLLGRWLRAGYKMRSIVTRARHDETWAGALRSICGGILPFSAIDVRVSGEVATPLVARVFRPVVVVPVAMKDASVRVRRAILLHELAHIRSRDCLWLAVGRTVTAIHFMNPLSWLAERQLRQLMEAAADDAVLRSKELPPSEYAQTLLDAARETLQIPATALAMAKPSELGRRLTHVLRSNGRREPSSRRAVSLITAVAVVIVGAIACTGAATPGAGAAEDGSVSTSDVFQGAAFPARDREVQGVVDDEAARTMQETSADGVSIVVLDPRSGVILGTHEGGRLVVPGSTVKPFTVIAALAQGLSQDARFDCEGGRWEHDGTVLVDASTNGVLSIDQILARSSNIGATKIALSVGPEALHGWLERVGLGRGLPKVDDTTFLRLAHVATGQGMTATPLELAAAYGILANDGVMVRPSSAPERIVPTDVTRAVRAMLEHVVYDDSGTGHRAQVDGVRVAGKTGTAHLINPDGGFYEDRYYASFVGMVPADEPALVVLVGVVNPRGKVAGGQVAAPTFARIVRRLLENGTIQR